MRWREKNNENNWKHKKSNPPGKKWEIFSFCPYTALIWPWYGSDTALIRPWSDTALIRPGYGPNFPKKMQKIMSNCFETICRKKSGNKSITDRLANLFWTYCFGGFVKQKLQCRIWCKPLPWFFLSVKKWSQQKKDIVDLLFETKTRRSKQGGLDPNLCCEISMDEKCSHCKTVINCWHVLWEKPGMWTCAFKCLLVRKWSQ